MTTALDQRNLTLAEKERHFEKIKSLHEHAGTSQESKSFYKTWANKYDEVSQVTHKSYSLSNR